MSANNPWDKKEKERKAKEKAEKEAKLQAEREAREKAEKEAKEKAAAEAAEREKAEKEASKIKDEVAAAVEEADSQPKRSRSKKSNKPPLTINKESKTPPKEPVHIFFDPDVKEVIYKKQKEKGHGWKSNYINDMIRWAFENEGWMEPKDK